MTAMRLWPRKAIILLIRIYQCTLSVWLPPSCRFTPTCSAYTLLAVERYGVLKGCWLGLCRILKCQPFHPGGYDPVPERPAPHAGNHPHHPVG